MRSRPGQGHWRTRWRRFPPCLSQETTEPAKEPVDPGIGFGLIPFAYPEGSRCSGVMALSVRAAWTMWARWWRRRALTCMATSRPSRLKCRGRPTFEPRYGPSADIDGFFDHLAGDRELLYGRLHSSPGVDGRPPTQALLEASWPLLSHKEAPCAQGGHCRRSHALTRRLGRAPQAASRPSGVEQPSRAKPGRHESGMPCRHDRGVCYVRGPIRGDRSTPEKERPSGT